MPAPPPFLDRFAPLAPGYDVVLSDVWGVVHNGLTAFPEACDALARFRAQGGTVLLITNAPRPADVVVRLLDRLHVPHEAYDGIVSSGDVTQQVIMSRRNERVFHIGPERDHSVFTDLGIAFAPVEAADYAVCSGLYAGKPHGPIYEAALAKAAAARGRSPELARVLAIGDSVRTDLAGATAFGI